MELVSRSNPLTKVNLSKTGADVVTDSKTPTIFATSAVFNEITASSTLNPKWLFWVRPFTVDAAETHLSISIF